MKTSNKMSEYTVLPAVDIWLWEDSVAILEVVTVDDEREVVEVGCFVCHLVFWVKTIWGAEWNYYGHWSSNLYH